jgi:hypothetical protein
MNEVSIDISELRKRKIFIATPMYGGHVWMVNILAQ